MYGILQLKERVIRDRQKHRIAARAAADRAEAGDSEMEATDRVDAGAAA
jgi:hypothetical protein